MSKVTVATVNVKVTNRLEKITDGMGGQISLKDLI